MSISCEYPDKECEATASISTRFARRLEDFDLESLYTTLVDSEIQLFFSYIFGIDIYSKKQDFSDIISQGKIVTESADNIIYQWNDIPVIQFLISPDYEYGQGYIIRSYRLYDIDQDFRHKKDTCYE